MWQISLENWWEFILRAVIVYVFLLALIRLTGKRQVGQMSPFDLILLLILSNAVQNSMNGGDNSVTGGLILAATLVGFNWIISWLTFRSKRIESLLEGRPVVLIHDGKIYADALKNVQMTMHELNAALRNEGFTGPEEVRFAVMEINGQVTVIPKKNHGLPIT
jgi:uncharacterized membrane protein YcaP (DUF421 family)